MTVECPSCGFASEDHEWCDHCGRPILETVTGARTPRTCPDCGAPEEGRFCPDCGHDFRGVISGDTERSPDPAARPDPAPGPAPGPVPEDTSRAATGLAAAARPSAAPTGFAVTVSADRAFHSRLAAGPGADPFPPYAPERIVPLTGTEIRIGRGRRGRPDRPEIDLSQPPADLAVSHLHAVILREGEGWTVVDLGSYNGTRLDGERMYPNAPKPFAIGSTLHLGAWTAIRLHAEPPGGP